MKKIYLLPPHIFSKLNTSQAPFNIDDCILVKTLYSYMHIFIKDSTKIKIVNKLL